MTDDFSDDSEFGEHTFTRDYPYRRGEYAVGNTRLPYFNITLRVGDALDDLALAREIMPDPSKPIELKELFQRDVDITRVNEEIVPYLEDPNVVKFFNALTVVLLPVDDSGRVLDTYEDAVESGSAPPAPSGAMATQVGPVQILTREHESPATLDFGRIRWDRARTKAVIVDGQHRFSAIQSAVARQRATGLKNSHLPVLLLVLDERAGFSAGGSGQPSVLEICRKVFIDLNKHAVQVPRTRRYLLDDNDLVAASMRSLLVGQTPQGSSPVAERLQQVGHIPLAVVDWNTEGAKVDTGMYGVTVPTLYDLTAVTLGQISIPPADYSAAREALDVLNARLELGAKFKPLKDSLDEAEQQQVPFSLTAHQVADCAAAFQASRGQLIVRLLTGFTPYKNLLEGYDKIQILNADIGEAWAALEPSARPEFLRQYDFENPWPQVSTVSGIVKAEYPLAFQVVFQKALTDSLNRGYAMRSALADITGEPDIAGYSITEFADWWLERANSRIVPTLGSSYESETTVWTGTALNSAGNLLFTQAARRGIGAVIAACIAAPAGALSDQKQARAWLGEAWGEIRRGPGKSPKQEMLSEMAMSWRDRLVAYERERRRAAGKDIPSQDDLRKAVLPLATQLLSSVRGGTS